jgi:hypothetical protein
VSCEEEDTCVSYEEDTTCVSYEEDSSVGARARVRVCTSRDLTTNTCILLLI